MKVRSLPQVEPLLEVAAGLQDPAAVFGLVSAALQAAGVLLGRTETLVLVEIGATERDLVVEFERLEEVGLLVDPDDAEVFEEDLQVAMRLQDVLDLPDDQVEEPQDQLLIVFEVLLLRRVEALEQVGLADDGGRLEGDIALRLHFQTTYAVLERAIGKQRLSGLQVEVILVELSIAPGDEEIGKHGLSALAPVGRYHALGGLPHCVEQLRTVAKALLADLGDYVVEREAGVFRV